MSSVVRKKRKPDKVKLNLVSTESKRLKIQRVSLPLISRTHKPKQILSQQRTVSPPRDDCDSDLPLTCDILEVRFSERSDYLASYTS